MRILFEALDVIGIAAAYIAGSFLARGSNLEALIAVCITALCIIYRVELRRKMR
jgi:hypothetical protein